MNENAFQSWVFGYMKKAGIYNNPVYFESDDDRGIYVATIPTEELRFAVRPGSMNVGIRTKNGRQFIFNAA